MRFLCAILFIVSLLFTFSCADTTSKEKEKEKEKKRPNIVFYHVR